MEQSDLWPFVSIRIITYNQENFIRQAIEGALKQTGDFKREILIVDDCSTDSTPLILKEYEKAFPKLIRIVSNSENIGACANFISSLSKCRGDFIALLDGDDYWLLEEKLDKQLEFLRNNPQVPFCFHAAVKVFADQRKPQPYAEADIAPRLSTAEILKQNVIAASSVVLRKDLLGRLPDWMPKMAYPDWALYVWLSRRGDAGFLNEVMSVYRMHERSVFNKNGRWTAAEYIRHIRNDLEFYAIMDNYLSPEYKNLIQDYVNERRFNLNRLKITRFKQSLLSLFPWSYFLFTKCKRIRSLISEHI